MTNIRSKRKKYKSPERINTVICPLPCGMTAERVDTRRTLNPRLLRIRLYRCPDHDFETGESILGPVVPHQRAKRFINTATVKRDRKVMLANDYAT